MNWLRFWRDNADLKDEMQQVGRVQSGKAMPQELLIKIAGNIAFNLQITSNDKLLDVCCGNGALTYKIAVQCKSITGIDFCEKQIATAKLSFTSNNIKYVQADALNFNLNQKFDKIYLYFSFQYFETTGEGQRVIENCLRHLGKGGMLFIGDIPDAKKWLAYYNTPVKIARILYHKLVGRDIMGKFWKEKELQKICKNLNVKGKLLKQESWQPYAYYRFDFLIKK